MAKFHAEARPWVTQLQAKAKHTVLPHYKHYPSLRFPLAQTSKGHLAHAQAKLTIGWPKTPQQYISLGKNPPHPLHNQTVHRVSPYCNLSGTTIRILLDIVLFLDRCLDIRRCVLLTVPSVSRISFVRWMDVRRARRWSGAVLRLGDKGASLDEEGGGGNGKDTYSQGERNIVVV